MPPLRALVIIESPFRATPENSEADHIEYARRAMRDSILRGEAPFASHLLYTQEGILDDTIPSERTLGIEAGHAWMKHCSYVAVYTDLGITPGMQEGIRHAERLDKTIYYRHLTDANAPVKPQENTE